MRILFLTLAKIKSIDERGIYTDLLRKFSNEGHEVYIVSPVERRDKMPSGIKVGFGVTVLNVWTLNLQKTNVVEKGVGTLAVEYQYLNAIKKYLNDVKFDLILYSTPPITFSKIIEFIKKRDNAYAYLLLKDIFPQNAVDMKMLKEGGMLHRFFLKKERKLYEVSDMIGCMSPANINYILKHNPGILPGKTEINPNTIQPLPFVKDEELKSQLKEKYNIPSDKTIFIYGGNLGVPQGIDFLLDVIGNCTANAFFIIVGSGTEYNKIKSWFAERNPSNALLLSGLPKEEYDKLLKACDVGMIFLHKDFTIPNFPSRLLSYLEMKMPVIAATDPNTDIGKIIEANGCGFGVLAGDKTAAQNAIAQLCDNEKVNIMGGNAYRLLHDEYLTDRSYETIVKHINRA